jgi:RHS repeat-associated protein
MEMQRMHQSNAALTLRSWWEKPAANDECASGKLFPGQYYDNETQLHYNYFRDYDPSTGRYIESDPIGLEGGVNTYVYVNNRTLNITDRFGLMSTGSEHDIPHGIYPPCQTMMCNLEMNGTELCTREDGMTCSGTHCWNDKLDCFGAVCFRNRDCSGSDCVVDLFRDTTVVIYDVFGRPVNKPVNHPGGLR